MLPLNAIILFIPYYGFSETQELQKLEKFYNIGKRQVYREITGEVIYYTLEKKI